MENATQTSALEQPLQPYLAFRDAAKAIEFYQRAFGATELFRLPMPGGKIAHAELQLGKGKFMLSDQAPEMDHYSAEQIGGTPITLCFYVDDVDAFVKRAEAAGAKVVRPVQNQFYGDRSGLLLDPFGYKWNISTHIEDVSPEEMTRRMQAMFAKS